MNKKLLSDFSVGIGLLVFLLLPLENVYASASVGMFDYNADIILLIFLLTIPMVIIATYFFTQGKEPLLRVTTLSIFLSLFFISFFIFFRLIFLVIFILGIKTVIVFLHLLKKKKRVSIINSIFFLVFLSLFFINIFLSFHLFIINLQLL